MKYLVGSDPRDWELLKKPLDENNGKINKSKFEERQKISIEIIREILDVHGKADIVKFLGELASIEPKIQELQPWVRDHVVHAINTFLLGVFILEKVNFPPFEGDYPFMWKLCGPTHDLGYPVEISHNISVPSIIKKLNDILDTVGSSSPRVELELYPRNLSRLCGKLDANQLIQKRVTEWELGINIKKYYKWLKKESKTDHGVVSALAQLKVVDALYYKGNPKRKYIDMINENGFNLNQKYFDFYIVSASSALFIHNIDLNYRGFSNKISFKLAPIAFLLFLCDTFQEWDRYSENRPVYSGDDFDINCDLNSISLFAPEEIEDKICAALSQRLIGLPVKVNEKVAVA